MSQKQRKHGETDTSAAPIFEGGSGAAAKAAALLGRNAINKLDKAEEARLELARRQEREQRAYRGCSC